MLALAQEERIEAQALQIAVSAPKVAVYDRVVANKKMTITDFAKRLVGVNVLCTKRDLESLGYLFRQNKGYEVYSKYRDVLFGMGVEDSYGNRELTLLAKGKELLTSLHAEGKLTMKVSHMKALKKKTDAR